MFNGYNETPLISYNDFNQERIEKKQENVPKWSYGHDAGVQPVQNHSNRHSEFWLGKSNFLGTPNFVKCSCTSCYTSSENQSYQGDNNRHRPWLPRTFPVPLNDSSESCKLPAYQWDNGLSNQGSCYSDTNLPYLQESGEKYQKYPYYRHCQNSKLPEANQPGVITSVKNAEYAKKPKNEMCSRALESPIQNAPRQTVFCNAAYNLAKRVDGRNHCNSNDKYSNVASCSVEQHIPRVPVVEPFLKTVPSNLSQNRVPSTGYRSVKENIPQPYIDSGCGDAKKICTEPATNGGKRNELFSTGQLQSGVQLDYSLFNRDLPEGEQQKSYFDNSRHPDYYSRNNIHDVIKRNHLILDNRKDCAMNQINQMSLSEQQYNASRSKYQEVGNFKSSFEAFYPKEFVKTRPENHLSENPACFQRIEDVNNENMNVNSRLPRSGLFFNDPNFSDKSQNSFPYQSNPVAYKNHLRTEYSYQNVNTQIRFDHPAGFQRHDLNQYKVTSQQMQNSEQFVSQQGSNLIYNHCQQNSNRTQEISGQKEPSSVQNDFHALEIRKANYLESIRSEEISKNGASKISPLRLLRKKKFINVPQENTPVSTLGSVPELDVRKFWSTWAEEEEEENVTSAQMVVLDYQNIDPEQAKLLNLYETDRTVQVESSRIVIKGSNCAKDSNIQGVHFEETKTCEEPARIEPKAKERENFINEKSAVQEEETEKAEENNSIPAYPPENKSPNVESTCLLKFPPKITKKVKSDQENQEKKKTEMMDKWTEKKFDFLKRAEESKAAEVLRHEEEKKKIFETRLSLQQTFKKNQKLQKKTIAENNEISFERFSSFDENSQSNSPKEGNTDESNLPTSEYRRNKFLDYSDRKVILNGKIEAERNAVEDIDEATEGEVKKEEKSQCWENWSDNRQTEKEFPLLNAKVKEETDAETGGILKKISDINFQSSGLAESECVTSKKWRLPAKKTKKKKSDQIDDERTDKLTVETVSKPTIKFSIQKSHDLKISFKVLNNSKEYSDEDVGGLDVEAEGNTNEDSKNSTELITLKYKSIQRDCDRKQNLDFIKNRRRFKKKKRGSEMKTPVLKIKKSRFMPQEERDPLANDEECLHASKKPYSDEFATSDDFQVQETMDSAKIKLTFKRHNKGNFETEYKINNNNAEEVSEPEPISEDHLEMTKTRKKSRRAKKEELFPETDVRCRDYPEPFSDIESGAESQKPRLELIFERDSRKLSLPPDLCTENGNENFKSPVLCFSELPSNTQFSVRTLENSPGDYDKSSALSEEKENPATIEDLKSNKETNKCNEKQVEFTVNDVINCDKDKGSRDNRDEFSLLNCNASPNANLKELTPGEVGSIEESQERKVNFEKEDIQEISLDFIRSTKSPEIEINHRSGKTEETQILQNVENNAEMSKEKSFGTGNLNEIRNSETLVENSCESTSLKNDKDKKAKESKNSKIMENSCGWKNDSFDVVNESFDVTFEKIKDRSKDFDESSAEHLLLETENYSFKKNFTIPEKHKVITKEVEETNLILLSSEEATESCPVEECGNNAKANCETQDSSPPGIDESSTPDSEVGNRYLECLVEDLASGATRSDTALFGNESSLKFETAPTDILFFRNEVKSLSEAEKKPNENSDPCRKNSSPAHPEPEDTNQSTFELSLVEPVENFGKSDSDPTTTSSFETAPEAGESVFWKNSSKICESEVCCFFENSSPNFSLKRNFSKSPNDSKTERGEIEFSLPEQEGLLRSEIIFEEVNLSLGNVDCKSSANDCLSGSIQNEADARKNEKESERDDCSFSLSKKITSFEIFSSDTNDLSVVVNPFNDKLNHESADKEQNDDFAETMNSLKFEVLTKNENCVHNSLEINYLEQTREKLLENSSVCTAPFESDHNWTTVSDGHSDKDTKADLLLLSEIELKDGEIIVSSDELKERVFHKEDMNNAMQTCDAFPDLSKFEKKHADFISRKIKRRHSTKPEKSRKKRESDNSELKTWSETKFTKANSCPPEFKFPEGLLFENEELLCIPVGEIPLPFGPPPITSCFNFKKNLCLITQTQSVLGEAKKKPEKSIFPTAPQVNLKEIPQVDSQSCSQSTFGQSEIQNCRNLSTPNYDNEASSFSKGIFRRSSKIKFSILKRGKFDLKSKKDLELKVASQTLITESKGHEESEKKDLKTYDVKNNEKIRTPDRMVSANEYSTPKEFQKEELPTAKIDYDTEEVKNQNDSEKIQNPENILEQHTELLCEDLDESVQIIDPMSNFMKDEFYECEDIPTSEDLTNGDELENEKVNDDKFRNIMQNCLDNAKKFLNVGNLKLFSCSIDDLLELDCQASSESPHEEKPTNHISRDVLLTSCDDTNDDLVLSENVPLADISMDFIPSFCSDVCPEILPVENWPYLEEEVASSPARSKQDDADLIPTVECASPFAAFEVHPKNGSERPVRRRVVSENNFESFRRRSLISDKKALSMCSKIGDRRRKTIEGLTEVSCGKNICNIKSELVKLKNETNEREKKSLKCRLSLEKLTSKHGIKFEFKKVKMIHKNGMKVKSAKNLDYKSPSWQPKVMLFRISKNELRKVAGSSKTSKLLRSKNSENSPKTESSCELDNKIGSTVKKPNFDSKLEEFFSKTDEAVKIIDERSSSDDILVSRPQFEFVKGSLTALPSKDFEAKRCRKSRFRNLHSKRKLEHFDAFKNENTSVQYDRPTDPTQIDAETPLSKILGDCNRGSSFLPRNSKEAIVTKNGDEKLKNFFGVKPSVSVDGQKASSKNSKIVEKHTESSCSHEKFKGIRQDRHREKSEKTHDYRDCRREKSEGREQRKHKDRHRESYKEKHYRHERNKRPKKTSSSGKTGERLRSESREMESTRKGHKATTSESLWTCEVCGFDDASQRVLHIKSHPFHCQSCYLAFKTETRFIGHLTKNHKDIRNQHHCLLCELSFDTEEQYYKHLETREHRHLESVEKNTINTLFTLLTGAPCPVLGLVEMKPEWLPNQSGTVHFYHQATPLSLALQYLKVHRDLSSFSAASSIHPT